MSAIINFREKLSRCKHWGGEHYGASGPEKVLKVAGPTPGNVLENHNHNQTASNTNIE